MKHSTTKRKVAGALYPATNWDLLTQRRQRRQRRVEDHQDQITILKGGIQVKNRVVAYENSISAFST